MVKEFTLSDEWRILRNAVSVYYKNIERDICSVIYVDVEKKYAGIYNEEQIKLIQHNEVCNSLSIIYNSIYKKFFNINNLDEFLKNPKWQNKISCKDLTKLILLLQKSTQIVKKDRGDYTYIEARIDSITNEEFLNLNFLDNKRGFEKCNSFSKEEIENKENFLSVFKKYLEIIFDDFRKEYFCRPFEDYLENVIIFTKNNSFLKSKHKEKYTLCECFEDNIKVIGRDYDGRNIIKITNPDGEIKYLADGEEVDIDDILFKEEENENPFDLEKFIANNNKNALRISKIEQEKQKIKKLKKKQTPLTHKEEYKQPELFDSF